MVWCGTLKVEPTRVIIFKNTVGFLLCVNKRSTDSGRLLAKRWRSCGSGGKKRQDKKKTGLYEPAVVWIGRPVIHASLSLFMHFYDAPFTEDVTRQNNRQKVPSQKSNNNTVKQDVQCGVKIPTY